MTDTRIHRAYSSDGTEIAGTVHGEGPPLVLVHAGLGDADATWPWFTESVRHIAEHVAHPHVREVAGAGHMGAWVKPESYAEELVSFFEAVLEPA